MCCGVGWELRPPEWGDLFILFWGSPPLDKTLSLAGYSQGWWWLLYTALFFTLEQTHCTFVACSSKWVTSFSQHIFSIHCSGVRTKLFGCHVADATWSCYHLGAFCVHHKPFMSCHFMQSHVLCSVHVCVAVRVQGLLISAPGHVTTTLPPNSAKPSGFLGPSNPSSTTIPTTRNLWTACWGCC